MSETLGNDLPSIARFTTSGTPDNVTEVIPPRGADYVTIQFITNAGKLATDQTLSDTDPVGTDYVTLAADTVYELRIPSGNSLFVASGTATTACEIVSEKDPN